MNHRPDSSVGDRVLTISCVCGQAYDAPALRLLKCPHCGHIWDLGHPCGDPPDFKPQPPMPLWLRGAAYARQMERAGLPVV